MDIDEKVDAGLRKALELAISHAPVDIDGETCRWNTGKQEYMPGLNGAMEFGKAMQASKNEKAEYGTAITLVMKDYLKEKEKNFPWHTGLPHFIVGPEIPVPHLARTDGGYIEGHVEKKWVKFQIDKENWQAEHFWKSYPHEFVLPEGYGFTYTYLYTFAWYVVVPVE